MIQKTHFADEDTLAHIAELERQNAELLEALKLAIADPPMSGFLDWCKHRTAVIAAAIAKTEGK